MSLLYPRTLLSNLRMQSIGLSTIIDIFTGDHSRLRQLQLGRLACVVAVLGRFLHSLNKYCLEEFNVQYNIEDYKQYDFASVRQCNLPAGSACQASPAVVWG